MKTKTLSEQYLDLSGKKKIEEGLKPLAGVDLADYETTAQQTLEYILKLDTRATFNEKTLSGQFKVKGLGINFTVNGENLYLTMPEVFVKEPAHVQFLDNAVLFMKGVANYGGVNKQLMAEGKINEELPKKLELILSKIAAKPMLKQMNLYKELFTGLLEEVSSLPSGQIALKKFADKMYAKLMRPVKPEAQSADDQKSQPEVE